MDIKHLLCQPYLTPIESDHEYPPSIPSSLCNSPSSITYSPPQTPPSTYRRRVQSDAFRQITEDSFIALSRRRSYSQTRTPWTPDEDILLQQGYEQGLSWAMVSSTYLPHRSRGCCWGRFKTLSSKNKIEVQERLCKRPWKLTSKIH